MLDLRRKLASRRKFESAGQLGSGHASRQLQQGKRVPRGLADNPVDDAAVEPAGYDAAQQRASVLLGQSFEPQLRQTVEVGCGGRLAHGDHDGHRLRTHPSRDEPDDLARGGVQPLRVLDEAQQRPLLRHCGEQAQHGQSGQESVGHFTGCKA